MKQASQASIELLVTFWGILILSELQTMKGNKELAGLFVILAVIDFIFYIFI